MDTEAPTKAVVESESFHNLDLASPPVAFTGQ